MSIIIRLQLFNARKKIGLCPKPTYSIGSANPFRNNLPIRNHFNLQRPMRRDWFSCCIVSALWTTLCFLLTNDTFKFTHSLVQVAPLWSRPLLLERKISLDKKTIQVTQTLTLKLTIRKQTYMSLKSVSCCNCYCSATNGIFRSESRALVRPSGGIEDNMKPIRKQQKFSYICISRASARCGSFETCWKGLWQSQP